MNQQHLRLTTLTCAAICTVFLPASLHAQGTLAEAQSPARYARAIEFARTLVTDLGASAMPASLGSYAWGGVFCTVFWVDPKEEVIGILMTQVRPYTHLNIRQDLSTLVYQAIIN